MFPLTCILPRLHLHVCHLGPTVIICRRSTLEVPNICHVSLSHNVVRLSTTAFLVPLAPNYQGSHVFRHITAIKSKQSEAQRKMGISDSTADS